jgi:hypothetical protein
MKSATYSATTQVTEEYGLALHWIHITATMNHVQWR